jgi:hypothetical protein
MYRNPVALLLGKNSSVGQAGERDENYLADFHLSENPPERESNHCNDA